MKGRKEGKGREEKKKEEKFTFVELPISFLIHTCSLSLQLLMQHFCLCSWPITLGNHSDIVHLCVSFWILHISVIFVLVFSLDHLAIPSASYMKQQIQTVIFLFFIENRFLCNIFWLHVALLSSSQILSHFLTQPNPHSFFLSPIRIKTGI